MSIFAHGVRKAPPTVEQTTPFEILTKLLTETQHRPEQGWLRCEFGTPVSGKWKVVSGCARHYVCVWFSPSDPGRKRVDAAGWPASKPRMIYIRRGIGAGVITK